MENLRLIISDILTKYMNISKILQYTLCLGGGEIDVSY